MIVIRLSRRRTFVAHRRFCLLAAISEVQCASMEAIEAGIRKPEEPGKAAP